MTTDNVNKMGVAGSPKKRDFTSFFQHTMVYGFGALLMQLASIVLLPVYTNYLTPEEYGVLITLYRIGEVFNICLMANGIRQAALHFWLKQEHEADRPTLPSSIAMLSIVLLLLGVLVVFSVAYLFNDLLSQKFDLHDPLLLATGVSAILIQSLTIMPLALMQARLESVKYVVTTIAIIVTQLTAVIVSVVFLKLSIWGVVLALLLTYGLFGVTLTFTEIFKSKVRPNTSQLRKIVSYSAPFIPTGICFLVIHNGDHFFILSYFGVAAAGIYGLGYRIVKGVVMLSFQPLLQVWGAWMYDLFKKDSCEVDFGRAYTQIVSVCMFFGLALLVFQNSILSLLSDEAYSGSAQVMAPLVFAHFFLILANLVDSAFYVKKKTGLKPIIAFATTVFILIAYYLLIPKYGTLGAAWATLIGYLFLCVLNLIVAYRVLAVKYEFGRLLFMLFITIGLYLVSTMIKADSGELIYRFCLLSLYPIIVWSVVMGSSERAMIRKWLFKTVRNFSFL